MIAASETALRKAVLSALTADANLLARLGGPRIYDEAPREAHMPYVAFGDTQAKDWSTSSDRGVEHLLTIDVWSQHRGVSEALEVSELVAQVLELEPLLMADYRLISLAPRALDTRRLNGARHVRARQTFRVVIEKI